LPWLLLGLASFGLGRGLGFGFRQTVGGCRLAGAGAVKLVQVRADLDEPGV
jgi:hypothetical protein